MVDNIEAQYGQSFQLKALSLLITNKSFLDRIIDVVRTEFFEGESKQWIVDVIQKYYAEFRNTPTFDVFKIKLKAIENADYRNIILRDLALVFKHSNDADLEFVEKEFVNFCKNQALKRAVIEMADDVRQKDYTNLRHIMERALSAGEEADMGHDYLEDVEDRLNLTRSTISLPWDELNTISDGGAGSGELWVVIGGTGGGKSWVLQNIGSHALKQGLVVFHYTLELSDHYTGNRYDSINTEILPNRLKNNQSTVKDTVNDIKSHNGKLLIKYYPTKGASVQTIRSHIKKCEVHGYRPDIIIIDYADCLSTKLSASTDRRFHAENVYEELRGLAGELGVPIWTASQSNRSGYNEEVLTADKIAESFSKVMIADFVFSIARTSRDKIANTGRVHVIKNRFGPDGMTFPAEIEIGIGKISLWSPDSEEGREVLTRIQNADQIERDILQTDYAKFKTSRADMTDLSDLMPKKQSVDF